MKRNIVHSAIILCCLTLLYPYGAQAKEKFTAQERETFRKHIDQIAQKFIADAVKKPQGVTWPYVTDEGSPQEELDFYTGDAGICYFLLKAYQATGQREYLREAERGLAYILSQAKRDNQGLYFYDTMNGLFQGNAGPGYALLYAFHVTKDKKYLRAAEGIANRIVAVPDTGNDASPDIISGAAGTGLFLLKMYKVTKDPQYRNGAEKLGDFLIGHAEPAQNGVKWKLKGEKQEYYFVGFSHGPAGIGYYLDRLYRITNKPQYKEYAEKAEKYIESIAVREKDYVKWYREELKRNTQFPSQWCHGAPGMNPFFLEFYDRTRDRKYLDWAETNTKYLLDQGVNIRKNASVCHGVTGNAASLFQMDRITGNGKHTSDIREAVKLLDRVARQDPDGFYSETPADKLRDKIDYSYMTGIAGVGDFFVLLYSNGRLNMMSGLGYGEDF